MKGEMIQSFLVSVYLHLINEEQPTRLSVSAVSCYTQVDLLLYINKMSLSALSGETLKKIQRKNLFLNHLGT